MDKILEVKNLTKLYRNGRGIKDINFTVYRGDVFGFLGPNGAGKTTVMKAITNLIHPEQGEVLLFGLDLNKNFVACMSKVGSLIENAVAYEYLTATNNLKLVARYYKDVDQERLDKVLELVGLEKYKNEKVANFSTGMKQRLGLAMAILAKPELIILDEPTNGLDIEGMHDIRTIIQQLANEEAITFFISSHLAHEVELICNRIGIVNNGQLIIEGSVKELLTDGESMEDFFIRQVRDKGGVVNE